MDDREAAWDAVHEAMPAGWRPGPVTYDPGRREWSVTALDERSTGRGKLPRSVTGTGEDGAAALRDLDAQLRGREDARGRIEELRARMRLPYVEGAEEWSHEHEGRGLAGDELGRVIGRYVGR